MDMYLKLKNMACFLKAVLVLFKMYLRLRYVYHIYIARFIQWNTFKSALQF